MALTTLVWANPCSLATTYGITFVFFSSRYLDVSVLWVCSAFAVISLQDIGLPHSEIHGSSLLSRSPWLIAAWNVFHRLYEPRHSPYALLYFLKYLKYFFSLHILQYVFFVIMSKNFFIDFSIKRGE
jgi:hypothetical protein